MPSAIRAPAEQETRRTHEVELPTGSLALEVEAGPDLSELCEFAARANPKRGFLIVSKVLGRHLPARPADMRQTMGQLAASLPHDLSQPVAFLGMAETATALGQGVFAAYQARHPDVLSIYLQTSRQVVEGATTIARFEEGHSHATSHLVQITDEDVLATARNARTLVIIDDECSTGNTFVSGVEGMRDAMPHLERVETCCITDWSGGAYLSRMPLPSTGHSIIAGTMRWTPGATNTAPPLAAGSNGTGAAPSSGMRSRSGLRCAEASNRLPVTASSGERILVLGDGEHSYEALLIAEEIERQGGVAAVQSITRTPATLGHAMKTVSRFTDAYGSGAPCFLYNILQHGPDRIIIACEIPGHQADEAVLSVRDLGTDVPAELVLCTYEKR